MQVGSLVVTNFHYANSSDITYHPNPPIVDVPYTVSAMSNTWIKLEEITNISFNPNVIFIAFDITKWREIQPPMEVNIESLIEESIEA